VVATIAIFLPLRFCMALLLGMGEQAKRGDSGGVPASSAVRLMWPKTKRPLVSTSGRSVFSNQAVG
jgi:hypothetical protein